jgi:uncharacterized protein YqeY
MGLFDQINAGITEAMRNREKDRLAALRDVKSKYLLEATKDGSDPAALPDAVGYAILAKLLKQRQETAALYDEQGRADLAQEERSQGEYIAALMPQPLSDAEVATAVEALVGSLGAQGMGDMGRVMAAAQEVLAGRVDGKVLAGAVRSALTR